MFQGEEQALNETLQKYNRTKEILLKDVEILKEWMKKQPHLPVIMDSKKLQNFLLLNKCSIERAKEKIDNYYTIPTKLADDMLHPKSPQIQTFLEIAYYVALPQLYQDKYRVWLFKMRNKNRIDDVEPICFLNLNLHMQEIRLNEDHMLGDVFIIDFEGINNFRFMKKLTPMILAKMIACYEKIYSIPLKGLYLLNTGSVIEGTLKILKLLLKPKLFQRVQACPDTTILEKMFKKDMIPSDYGGNEKSLEEIQDMVKTKMNKYQDRYDQLAKFKVDENLRPEKPKDDDILGYYGSFKQINFD